MILYCRGTLVARSTIVFLGVALAISCRRKTILRKSDWGSSPLVGSKKKGLPSGVLYFNLEDLVVAGSTICFSPTTTTRRKMSKPFRRKSSLFPSRGTWRTQFLDHQGKTRTKTATTQKEAFEYWLKLKGWGTRASINLYPHKYQPSTNGLVSV